MGIEKRSNKRKYKLFILFMSKDNNEDEEYIHIGEYRVREDEVKMIEKITSNDFKINISAKDLRSCYYLINPFIGSADNITIYYSNDDEIKSIKKFNKIKEN